MTTLHRRVRRNRLAAALTAIGAMLVVLTPFPATPASSQTSLVGASGIDTGLPPTASALTIKGRGRFASLSVTVSQTANLTNQAVSVSWTGAAPGETLANNFVQIFQCWGDDDGTVPGNPGPPPEQCQFGGEPIASNVVPKIPTGTTPSFVYTRTISQESWGAPYFDRTAGFYDPATRRVWKPFRAVDGKVVDAQSKIIPPSCTGCFGVGWQNPYFDYNTTNERPWARTYANGNGSELFQVLTGLEAPGLGCGQKKQPTADGSTVVPRCWLVVVPRSGAAEENPAPLAPPGYSYVATSPLSPEAWANRIAFPLSFNPVDSPCVLGADSRRIVGNELAVSAVTSWQPKLCATPGSPPYSYSAVADDQARRQLLSGTSTAPGMAVVSGPVAPASIDAANPVVYAPLTLSGLVIGFNIERVPTDAAGNVKDPDQNAIAATRVTTLNLTPRLVAKLLTQSYSVPFYGNRPASYAWVASQPLDLSVDPDFIQFNPEFSVMTVGSRRTTAALTVPASNSDAAREVWRWILADPEAKAWLEGKPDEWGMKVNPLYNATAAGNPSGQAFGNPVPNVFPKNDPYCYQEPAQGDVVPRPLCLLDIQPYGLSMALVAQATRAANDGALTSHDPFSGSQQTANTWWAAEGPQPLGSRSMIAITDSASAFRYGLRTANLSRAGDNGTTRTFIAADAKGFETGIKAMTSDSGVLVPDPKAQVPGAYPLTLLTYAATQPKGLDAGARTAYADFLKLAVGDGQTPGDAFGQLPPGYAPLPPDLKTQAVTAESHVRAGTAPSGSDSTPTTSPTTTTTTAAAAAATATTRSATGTTAVTTRVTTSGVGTGTTVGSVADFGPAVTISPSPSALTPVSLATPDTLGTGPLATTAALAPGDNPVASGGPSGPSTAAGVSPGNTPGVTVSSLARYAILVVLLVGLLAASGVAAMLTVDEGWQRKINRLLSGGGLLGPLTRLRQQLRLPGRPRSLS